VNPKLLKVQPPMGGLRVEDALAEASKRQGPLVYQQVLPGADFGAMGLAMKALEADAERWTVSHFASRQLAYAAGMLPQHVAAPEWIQHGLGSFFETPLGAPWGGPTAANCVHRKTCVEVLNKETDLVKVLKQVVTDDYFRQAEAAAETDAPAALAKARALSWGLTYYLLKDTDRLAAYRDELDKMPRDLALDADVVLGCFARAVNAVDGDKVSDTKLKDVAVAWRDFLKIIPVGKDLGSDDATPLLEQLKKSTEDLQKKLTPP
jgi:hypothetical protein